jgi:hypothetical protein
MPKRRIQVRGTRTLRPRVAQWIGKCSQAKRRIAVLNASGCSRLTRCGAFGMTTSVDPGMRACRSRPTTSAGERTSASPSMSNVGTVIVGSTSRRSPAPRAVTAGRTPVGRKSRIIVATSSTTSGDAVGVSSVGSRFSMVCSTGAVISRSICCRRRSVSSADRDPAQPAYAEARTSAPTACGR